jgi:RHS repeat-associated protein
MQMQLSSGTQIPDGLLADIALRNEKPRLGVPSRNPALHQGIDASNSTIVLGLQSTAALNRIGSRSTGKERDTESGLDYFGARYYASNMGRWMSPDWSENPEAVPYSHLDNPQSLNLYGYVLNNPLSKPDLDGHGCPPDCSTGNNVVDFFLGAANAFSSDNLLGAGRVNQTSSGGQLGQALGDAAATLQGAAQVVVGTGGNIAGVALDATGIGAAVGVPVNVVSTAVTVEGAGAATMGAVNLMKAGGNFSSGTKQGAKDAAGGKCQSCGVETTPGQKSQKGVTPPGTEGQTDHIQPKSKGGTNDPSNAQHLCRDCNIKKSDKLPNQQ